MKERKFANLTGKLKSIYRKNKTVTIIIDTDYCPNVEINLNIREKFQSNKDIFSMEKDKLKELIGQGIIIFLDENNGAFQGVIFWDRDYITVDEYRGILAYIEDCEASNVDVNRRVDYMFQKDVIKF
jgi:hypothetical protein